jgi:hypothetical protein
MNSDSLLFHNLAKLSAPNGVTRLRLEYEAEQLPSRSSYVQLADATDGLGEPRAHLHWEPGHDDIDTIIRSTMQIGRHCGEGRAWPRPA